MEVTVDVKGEETTTVELASLREDATATGGSGGEPTYADLLAAVDVSPHEVSVLVDGRPVPEDQPVATNHVTVIRLIKGG